MESLHPDSVAVASGRPHEPGRPVNEPLVLAATYRADEARGVNAYLRNEGSPTIAALEAALGALDGGHAVAFASGMAAVAAVADRLPAGTVAVVPASAYNGTVALFTEQERLGRLDVRRVDITDSAAVRAALPGAGLLWLETVTNPLLGVCDGPALVAAAHEQGALVAVDATFSSPRVCRPLEWEADLVMHSATKYLAGHSDVLLGVVVAGSAELAAEVAAQRRVSGAVPGALESFLALRGIRTLGVRLDRAQHNAGELARRLAAHPRVARVRYPGLPTDPGHALATRLHDGFGAMISFEVAGTAEDAARVCRRVALITHATSLGGVESLIERRARYPLDAAGGTPETLLRLSVGIEHVDDLWRDLEHALG